MHTGLRLEILQARDRSDELDIHGSTKLKSILRKKTGWEWTRFVRQVTGCCEHGNEPWGFINSENLLTI